MRGGVRIDFLHTITELKPDIFYGKIFNSESA